VTKNSSSYTSDLPQIQLPYDVTNTKVVFTRSRQNTESVCKDDNLMLA